MLINWSYGEGDEKDKSALLSALGIADAHCRPRWPLPNMKPSDEREFWGWQASYSPRARLWLGNQNVEGEHATILVYWMGETHPSFAIAVIYRGTVAHHALYFRWQACEHDWQIVKSGNCWRDYRCSKCPAERHEDSSG